MGTDLHQMTIINLRWGMNEIAHSLMRPGDAVPWQALSQTVVSGFARRDGTRLKTLPDVFVYRRPIDQSRGSLAVHVDGPPAVIIEVLSDRTFEVDLDMESGKGFSYAQAGVREYLTLDPTGVYLPERGRGWRLTNGAYASWAPDGQGRWHSEEIAVAIGLEGAMAAVYARQGRRMLREGEIEEELARRDAERAHMEAEIERLRRLLDDRGDKPQSI